MSEVKKIVMFETSDDAPDPQELAWAFPDVKPGMEPFGGRVIVQLRRIKRKLGALFWSKKPKRTKSGTT
jgi:hypothetical protein